MLDHTALLNERKADWEERGRAVSVENQNTFRLRGQTATLAGKPDLIAARGDDVMIFDVKTSVKGGGKTYHWVS